MRRHKTQSWGPGTVPLAIGAAIVLLVLLGAPKIMGADKKQADSVWIQIKPPQEESKGRAVRMVCPICGQCYPRQADLAGDCTLAGCECCNKCDFRFQCRTFKDSIFVVTIGECDWIKWGRKVAKKDIDSLVDKSDWTIKVRGDKPPE